MKKIIYCATAFMFILGMANAASAAKRFTTAATTVLNGVGFSPSTSVGLSAIASTTAWAAAAKHEAGGTTQYGLLSTDTNIKMKTELAKDTPVTDQDDVTALKGF
jgi:hypothetical protein